MELSLEASRPESMELSLGEPDVVLRYPGNFWRAARIDDPSADYEGFPRRRLIARASLNALIDEQLELTNRKEVIIYIHGYNNTFNDAITTIANLWHFMGRQDVPIAYKWPAGSGGLTGYTSDSESGEFTIFHLKMFLEDLAANPNVERISILAHSRGTDVTISAIRELGIAARAAGLILRRHLSLAMLFWPHPTSIWKWPRNGSAASVFPN